MKAAIYARVSSDMQAEEELPIRGQIEECEKFCAQREWEVVKVYKDEGFTGRNTDRPAFVELLADAKKKQFGKIVIWKGSRIARNVQDRLATETFLGKLGIDVVSLNEPEMEGSTRVLMLPIMAAMDEYQSYIIAEDTLRGLKALARQGYSTGGRPPKGYRVKREPVGIKKDGSPLFRSKWEPDPEWRDLAVKAFEMLAEGKPSRDIISATHVVKNPTGMVTYFRNPTFVGERVFNVHQRIKGRVVKVPLDHPDVIRIPNAHEALISRDLFDRCQVMLDKRRHGPGQVRAVKHDFVLSGVLWCETHNCPITGSGNRFRKYYVCESFRRGGRKASDCPSLHKEKLENFILSIIKDKILTRSRIKESMLYLINSIQDENKERREIIIRIKAQMTRLDIELERLYQAISDGELPAKSLAEPITQKQQQRESLQRKIDDAKQYRVPTGLTMAMVDQIREQVVGAIDGNVERKRQFVNSCVERIKIAGASITINFSVKESPASCQHMVAGALLSLLATKPYISGLPNSVFTGVRHERVKMS